MITNNKKPRFCMGNTLTKEELFSALCDAAGYMKVVCGVGNNAAHMVMLDGCDHARQCRAYRHEVKRAFKAAIDEWHAYERHLLHEQHFRMFCVKDMPERIRQKYGDITDREYYDYWSATGCAAYEKTRPLLTCLQNKYRKSMERHGYRDAGHVAWVMVSMSCLQLACALYDGGVRDCVRDYRIPKDVMQTVFGQLSPRAIKDKWQRAAMLLSDGMTHPLDKDEERDIALGLQQLTEAWTSDELQSESVISTAEEYSEVFRDAETQRRVIEGVSD